MVVGGRGRAALVLARGGLGRIGDIYLQVGKESAYVSQS